MTDAATQPLACGFLVARTNASPRTQVVCIRKHGHLRADFGKDILDRHTVDAGNGIESVEVVSGQELFLDSRNLFAD